MSTLLLRFAAPLQSWGVDSKYENRRGTERAPTKSGVIGLIAAALGRKRNESVEDLYELRFGVRVDREGELLRDYQTVKSEKPYVTHRHYLSDAVFLVGLEGDAGFLSDIDWALHHPVYALSLGRRSCPPEGRISLGIRVGKFLDEALKEEPWLIGANYRSAKDSQMRLRIITDAEEGDAHVYYQRDIPISFDQSHRRFGFRPVSESHLVVTPSQCSYTASDYPTQHDPMTELNGG